jgi:thioesterase domain-containing protein
MSPTKSVSLRKSSSRNIIKESFVELIGQQLQENLSIWDQGVSSLSAIVIDQLLFKKTGVKLGISALLSSGFLDDIAEKLDRGVINKEPKKQELQSNNHMKVRKFYSAIGSNEIVIFVSSFGLLAETALSFINVVKMRYHVYVFEFAGISASPEEIAERLVELLEKEEKEKITCVSGHSAGGIWGCEIAKNLLKKGCNGFSLAFFDSFFPKETTTDTFQTWLESPIGSVEKILRFVLEPLSKICGKNSFIPKEYLRGAFIDVSVELGYSVTEGLKFYNAYQSKEMEEMVQKMMMWRGCERMDIGSLYVKAWNSPPNAHKKWEKLVKISKVAEVAETHFKMLESSGKELLQFLSP